MTKESYEKLKPYEQVFRWAIYSNFVHMSAGEFNTLAGLYNEVYKTPITKAQSTCNACRLRALKQLGNDYFAKQQEIAKREEKKKQQQEQQDKALTELQTMQGEQEKKPVGRPKSIDLDAEE